MDGESKWCFFIGLSITVSDSCHVPVQRFKIRGEFVTVEETGTNPDMLF